MRRRDRDRDSTPNRRSAVSAILRETLAATLLVAAVFAATVLLHEAAHAVAFVLSGAEDVRLAWAAVHVGDTSHVTSGEALVALGAGPLLTAVQALAALLVAARLLRGANAGAALARVTLWTGCVAAAYLAFVAMTATAGSDIARLLDAAGAELALRRLIATVGLLALLSAGVALRVGLIRSFAAREPADATARLLLHAPLAWVLGVGVPSLLLLPARDWPLAWGMGLFTLVVLVEPPRRGSRG